MRDENVHKGGEKQKRRDGKALGKVVSSRHGNREKRRNYVQQEKPVNMPSEELRETNEY